MTQEPGKRIVSKREYKWFAAKRAGIHSLGIALLLVGCLTALGTFGFLVATLGFLWYFRMAGIGQALLCIVSSGALCYLTHVLGNGAATAMDRSVQLEERLSQFSVYGCDVPASDSLVRASQEPLQAQETVLLRAASEGAPTSGEELLRASAGEQE